MMMIVIHMNDSSRRHVVGLRRSERRARKQQHALDSLGIDFGVEENAWAARVALNHTLDRFRQEVERVIDV